jgi:Ca-activated chloride channel family protein
MRLVPSALALLLAAATAARAGDLVPTDGRFGPLRVASHRVEVTVDNQIAMTRVEQVFANDHAAQLEAHYVFPAPKGASIIDFSMTVNGKLMRGELLEKGRARQIYEGIVRQSKDPGLLEHAGANIFRVRVFPIFPNSQQRIELTYLERVNYDNGSCRWTYPLLVPGGARSTKADLFELRFRLASAVPIKDLACPTHPAAVALKSPAAAEVTYEGRQVDLSRDLEIAYRIEREKSGMDLAAHKPEKEDPGAFMLLLTPEAGAARLAKDTTFVFDTSGSMEGKRIRQARAALKFCLAKLGPEDRFNILTFSGEVAAFERAHVAATDQAKERAAKFVDAIDASGATNINAALLRALEHKADAARPHLVLFLTDGHPTAGETRAAQIVRNVSQANAANVRIFAFGVGNDLNRQLLEDLAEATRAVAEFVAEDEDIEEKVSRLQKKVATPVISELSIDWGQAEVESVHPRILGDLFAGTQLLVTGRYRKAGTFEVALRGRAGAQAVELRQKIAFPEKASSAGIPYFWAMRKIAGLLDEIRRSGENAEVRDEVVALSRKYRIATPYTSFLVLETEQAYDQHGVDRKDARWEPPKLTAQAPAPPPSTGKVYIPGLNPVTRGPVYRKDAAEADHNETADEEFLKAKGDSLDFVSDKPFKGKSTYDVIGGGAGGGSRFGSRLGGKRNLVARGGGGADTEDAVLSALKWLSRHQAADGSWKTTEHTSACGRIAKYAGGRCTPNPGHEDNDGGNTGLALLAFLGAGYSHLSKDMYDGICFGDVVRKALQWMMSRQDPEGCIGSRTLPKYMYHHAISALALSEAYGLTGSNLFRDQAQKAIDFLIAAQNPGKGWRYSYRSGDNDTSVTAWAILALKSAEISGLAFPRSGYDGARAWFDEATDEKGRTGYTARGTGKVFIAGG